MAILQDRKSRLRSTLETALRRGLQQGYETVKVDPSRFLLQLRAAYGLPISSFQGVYTIEPAVLDNLATRIVRSGMKVAAVEGAGLGLGGMLTLVPDLSILAAITLRTLQKLSLLYGFEYNTEEETAELWIAAASAAGVDISRELLEREVVNRFVPEKFRPRSVRRVREVLHRPITFRVPPAGWLRRRFPEERSPRIRVPEEDHVAGDATRARARSRTARTSEESGSHPLRSTFFGVRPPRRAHRPQASLARARESDAAGSARCSGVPEPAGASPRRAPTC